MRVRNPVAVLLAAGAVALVSQIAAQPPDGGVRWQTIFDYSAPGTNSEISDLAVDESGKSTVAGSSGYPDAVPALARIDANGDFDPAFGDGGRLVAPFGTALPELGGFTNVAIEGGSGKIVAAGRVYDGNPVRWSVIVARLLPNGDPDLTFGGAGYRRIEWTLTSGHNFFLEALLLQRDGKIVLAGRAEFPTGLTLAAIRLTADGLPDPNFGFGGFAGFPFLQRSSAYDVAEQPDGKLVLVGTIYGEEDFNPVVVRLTSAGALDPSFGAGGIVEITRQPVVTDELWQVELAPGGRILAAGHVCAVACSGFYGFAMRLTRAGALDPTFGQGGFASLNQAMTALGLALQGNGRILVAGYGLGPGSSPFDMAVIRLKDDGERDASFGVGGLVWFDSGGSDLLTGFALSPSGRVLLAGQSSTLSSGYDAAVIALDNAYVFADGFESATTGAWSASISR